MPKQTLDEIFGKTAEQSPSTQTGSETTRPSLEEIFGRTKAQPESTVNKPGIFSGLAKGLASTGKAIGGFGVGFAKGVASLPQEAAKLGSEIGLRTAAAIRPGVSYEDLKTAIQKQEGTATGIVSGIETGIEKTKEQFAPEGGAEKAGFATEKIAEFLVPAGAATKTAALGKATSRLAKAPKIVAKGGELLSRAGFEGLEQAARVALQTGGDEKAVKEAAVVGAAFPIAIPILKGLGSIGKNVLKTAASKLSGVPTAAIEHAFANPEATQKAIRTMAKDPVVGAQGVLQNAEDALQTLKNVRRETYRTGLKKLEDEIMETKEGSLWVKRLVTPGDVKSGLAAPAAIGKESFVKTDLSLKGVKDTVTKTLKDFGAQAKGVMIDLNKVALPKSYKNEINEVVDKIYAWDDITPSGLDDLRENIDVFKKSGVVLSSADSKFNKIIGDIRSNLSKYVGDRVPQIRDINAQYAAHSDVISNIMQELSLGKEKGVTALRKLTNVFNPRSEVYRPIVQELGERAGQDLMTDIAGLTMAKWTPEGLSAFLSTIGGGALGVSLVTAPLVAAKALPAAALASPRAVGELVTTAGKAAPQIKKMAEPVGKAARGLGAQIIEKRAAEEKQRKRRRKLEEIFEE